jgi:hypothetical protein
MPPVLKTTPEQLLKVHGLALLAGASSPAIQSGRFNARATHIRRSSWSTSGAIWREAGLGASLRRKLRSVRQKSVRTEVRDTTASGLVGKVDATPIAGRGRRPPAWQNHVEPVLISTQINQ